MAVADPKEVEEEDWLPPPPKSIKVGEISADGSSILSELRWSFQCAYSLIPNVDQIILNLWFFWARNMAYKS